MSHPTAGRFVPDQKNIVSHNRIYYIVTAGRISDLNRPSLQFKFDCLFGIRSFILLFQRAGPTTLSVLQT
jgi:hypothetical protein